MVIEADQDKLMPPDAVSRFEGGEVDFDEMKEILKRSKYGKADISKKLISCLESQISDYERQIRDHEKKKINNHNGIEVKTQVSSLPSIDNTEKVIKYEKALQKSIFQNLIVLKKLQSLA